MILFSLAATAVTPACMLLGWIAWLRFARHVHDKSGPQALKHLPAVAQAFRERPCTGRPPSRTTSTPRRQERSASPSRTTANPITLTGSAGSHK
jgi:hypothetical protein